MGECSKFIDFTSDDGVITIEIDYRASYICDKPIVLSDNYLYYETDWIEKNTFMPCALVKESGLPSLEDNTNYNMLREYGKGPDPYIWCLADLTSPRHMYIVASKNGNSSFLVSSDSRTSYEKIATRLGFCFNNKEILFINNNNVGDKKILRVNYPNNIDPTGNIRVIYSYDDHITEVGATNHIYTSENNFVLTDILQENGITKYISLYDYFKGTQSSGSNVNKVDILKIY